MTYKELEDLRNRRAEQFREAAKGWLDSGQKLTFKLWGRTYTVTVERIKRGGRRGVRLVNDEGALGEYSYPRYYELAGGGVFTPVEEA